MTMTVMFRRDIVCIKIGLFFSELFKNVDFLGSIVVSFHDGAKLLNFHGPLHSTAPS